MKRETWTAAAIAHELRIPESTARFWIRRYRLFIPTTGRGRQRRYQREALAVLQFVVDRTKDGYTPDMIEREMMTRFPLIEEEQQQVSPVAEAATEPQELLDGEGRALFDALVRQAVADETSGIMAELVSLRQEVARLSELIERQQAAPTATEPQQPPPPADAPPDPTPPPAPAPPTWRERLAAWLGRK